MRVTTLAFAITTALATSGTAWAVPLPGETCTGAGGSNCPVAIAPSPPSLVNSSFTYEGCTGPVTDIKVGLDVSHTWVGDLKMTLTAPDATSDIIFAGSGCASDNIFAVLDDSATESVQSQCSGNPAVSGTLKPTNPLSVFNGVNGNGSWTLKVEDLASGDGGTLNNWSLDILCGPPQPRAKFTVNKVFEDGNPGEVEVTLSCNTGLPLQQSQEISTDQNVVFVVESYDDGELDCEVTESVPEGYEAQYGNCEYTDLPWSATETCNITNTPLPVTVEVAKDWVIEGSGGDSLDPGYKLKLTCEDEIVGGHECGGQPGVGVGDDYGYYCQEGTWSYKWWNDSGTNDATYTAAVIPDWDGGTSCWVEESVYDDSIEIGNGCNDLHVAIAEGDECTITNTVFYEGIPALNPYGLVILTLSMLGLGFTAFRRYS